MHFLHTTRRGFTCPNPGTADNRVLARMARPLLADRSYSEESMFTRLKYLILCFTIVGLLANPDKILAENGHRSPEHGQDRLHDKGGSRHDRHPSDRPGHRENAGLFLAQGDDIPDWRRHERRREEQERFDRERREDFERHRPPRKDIPDWKRHEQRWEEQKRFDRERRRELERRREFERRRYDRRDFDRRDLRRGDRVWGYEAPHRSRHVARIYHHLPPRHDIFRHRGERYHFHHGRYYRHTPTGFVLVRPPVGMVVASLPLGFRTVISAGLTFYSFGDVFYRRVPAGYEVVEPMRDLDRDHPERVVVGVDELNVRYGPDEDEAAIAQVTEGMELKVLGAAPGWLYVEVEGEDIQGWVMEQYVVNVTNVRG